MSQHSKEMVETGTACVNESEVQKPWYSNLKYSVVGILFGYLYHKTKDLKLNIFIHALYNSLQVVLNYLHENKIIQSDIEEIKSVPILLWIVCLILVSFLTYKLIEDHEHISHTS